MGAHVFVVDKFSFPVHSSRGFCGVKNPLSPRTRNAVYADLKAIREGDLIFFYQRRIDEPPEARGFRGVFKAISEPFVDSQNVGWGENRVLGECPACNESYSERKDASCPACGHTVGHYGSGDNLVVTHHILPNRVMIEPLDYYEIPVNDNAAYVNRLNHGTLWSMLFRKIFGAGRERSINQILPEEANKLERLLRKLNDNRLSSLRWEPYSPKKQPIHIELESVGRGILRYESILQAWIMENIDRGTPVFSDVVPTNEIEYFGNWITYGIGGESVDMLVTYKDQVRYKAIPIELKRDALDAQTMRQLYRYAYWIAQFSTANAEPPVESLILQPVGIGHRIPKAVVSESESKKAVKQKIPYPEHPCEVTINPPILLTYNVTGDIIEFERKI